MAKRVVRLPEVKRLSGLGRSTIYTRVAEHLFPKPFPLGPRMIGWLESEIFALNAARVRGASNDEIIALVASLEADRKGAA